MAIDALPASIYVPRWTSWTEGLIDWSIGVAVGRGTIVITIVCTWREGVQRGEIVFLLVHQRRWDISLKTTTTCCLSGKKEAGKAIIQSACIVKVECIIEVNQTKHLHLTGREWLFGRGSMLLLAEGWCIGPCYTIDCLLREMCKGKQQSLSQCTQCNAHCLF